MTWLNLDVHGHELGEDEYCSECDKGGITFTEIPVNEIYNRFECDNCGAIYPKLVLSDYGYQLQQYLLNGSEFDEGVSPIERALEILVKIPKRDFGIAGRDPSEMWRI